MKTTTLFCLLICLTGIIPEKAFCISCMQAGPDTIRTGSLITGSCIINGDLVILNGASLHVDLTGAAADTFVVRGNILLQGNATLFINADSGSTAAQFIVSNSSNNQRTITTRDSSRIILQYIEFRTQEGDLSATGSYYMNYYAYDNSALSVTSCWLNPQKAWLLCNLMNKSTLIGDEANELPTEIYLQDTAQMSLHGTNTAAGIWLIFAAATDTINLPDQTGQYFSWQAGRGAAGVHNAQWFLNVDSAKPGLGVQIQPFSKLVVNGRGLPATGEIHVNLLFAHGTDTIENLNAGLQNGSFAKGRLVLNNVNLGPIAWQLYAVSDDTLSIKNSIVNEIGVVGPANIVTVDSSLLQLATLSALGTAGSLLTVSNSDIWSQAIIAANSCTMTLNNCNVTGSWFSADALSHITINGGCFLWNPSGCTQNTMVNINTGHPYCNPFIPAGFPQNITPASVTFNGVNTNCVTAAEELNNNPHLTAYPNPFSTETKIQAAINLQNSTLTVYNSLGQQVRQIVNISSQTIVLHRDNLPGGMYFIRLTDKNEIVETFRLVITGN